MKTAIVENIVNSLGWTLLHSVWQGIAILLVYLLLILILRKRNIRTSYNLGVALLFLFVGIVVATYILEFKNHQIRFYVHEQVVQDKTVLTNAQNAIGDIYDQVIYPDNEHPNSLASLVNTILFYLNKLSSIVATGWLVCITLLFIRQLAGFFKLKQLLRHPMNQRYGKWQTMTEKLSAQLSIKRKTEVLFNPIINSPFVFGAIKPVILFPIKLITQLSEEEIQSILIHEMAHIMRHDSIINIFQLIVESLFFYHPGINYISKQVHQQREIICDEVVGQLYENKRTYIEALVKVEELRITNKQFALAAKKKKNELLERIQYLLPNSTLKHENQRTGLIVPITAIIMVAGLSILFLNRSLAKESNENSRFYQIASKYLPPEESSMVVYDLKNQKYLVFNDSLSHKRYTPASTFKVLSSMIALETGVAKDVNFTIRWDSIRYPAEPGMRNNKPQQYWLQDQTMRSALKYSVNWYFIDLNQLIGLDRIKRYTDLIGYGNKVVNDNTPNFWFNGTTKISAIEQVKFFEGLYNKQLEGFSKGTQEAIKGILPNEMDGSNRLYGKTGTGQLPDGTWVCWYVGYYETKQNTYIFALNSKVGDYTKMSAERRIEATKNILKEIIGKGVFH